MKHVGDPSMHDRNSQHDASSFMHSNSPADFVASATHSGPGLLHTMPPPIEPKPKKRTRARLSLFWRTFFLLAVLLVGSIIAWLQTFRFLDSEPRAAQSAHQIASIVNLSRAALVHSDAIGRLSLIKQLAELEGVKVIKRNATDVFLGFDNDLSMRQVLVELRARLDKDATLARSVNAEEGLWVGFEIDSEQFWIQTDLARLHPVSGRAWAIWLGIAAMLSLAGAAMIARLINRPLKALSYAASRIREGDFDAGHLSESAVTSEIREVNSGFNRMAAQLAKIDQDRAIMLAGISHDLRTPLARLRLETEMSVGDDTARNHMVSDLEQLDAIIDKFLDYARPADKQRLKPIVLRDVIEVCVWATAPTDDFRVKLDLPKDLQVMGDDVELTRVITNLVENARKYGKDPATNITRLDITARARQGWVLLKVRDHGPGVNPQTLKHLTKPFYRGDVARTAATGAGLGLAIVKKTLERLGGSMVLSNSTSGGFAANIQLLGVKQPTP